VEGGGWRVEGGGWRVEGGGWRVEGGGWRGRGRPIVGTAIVRVAHIHRVLLDALEAHCVEVEVLSAAVCEERVRRHVTNHGLREVEVMRVLLHRGEVDAIEVARRPEVTW
jgi:hypothetical protein